MLLNVAAAPLHPSSARSTLAGSFRCGRGGIGGHHACTWSDPRLDRAGLSSRCEEAAGARKPSILGIAAVWPGSSADAGAAHFGYGSLGGAVDTFTPDCERPR